MMTDQTEKSKKWWDEQAEDYQSRISISTADFHYGPLLPGDSQLELLPSDLGGKRCLELACGAGQNSIFLAAQGAVCTAIDSSSVQIKTGRSLATAQGLDIDFIEGDMDDMRGFAGYDLVHSNSLSFSDHPEQLIRNIYKALNPGGRMVMAAIHPLFAAEWLEVDDEACGLFVLNYFNPPDDFRESSDGEATICSRSWPVSKIINWTLDAGFLLTRVEEPQAIDEGVIEASPDAVPYFSPEWMMLHDQLSKTPLMLIIAADKPDA